MSNSPVATTTSQAIKVISAETGIDQSIVELIVIAYIRKIRVALRYEMPFAIRGLGKLSFRYMKRVHTFTKHLEYYSDKVVRELKFTAADEVRAEVGGWVHDFGIKENTARELMRVNIKPEELDKLRKKKTLDEQRSLGFRSDLLFDDLPESEVSLQKQLGDSLTIGEIMRRIGVNLDG